MKNKFAVLLQIVFIYFSWQQGHRLLSGLFTRCSQWTSLGLQFHAPQAPSDFYLVAGAPVCRAGHCCRFEGISIRCPVRRCEATVGDCQGEAKLCTLHDWRGGRQTSWLLVPSLRTGEEGDKPPGSWRPAPHSPAEDIAAVKTVFVFTPQSFVLGQTQSQVWGAAAPFHYRGNTSHR